MTDELDVRKQLMRMHGFNLMATVIRSFPKDKDIIKLVRRPLVLLGASLLIRHQPQVFQNMLSWPLVYSNKVEDSKVDEPVKSYRDDEDETVRDLARQVCQTSLAGRLRLVCC